MSETGAVDGTELIGEFIRHSPFARELGLELSATGDGAADVRLPFRPELATYADVLHGGAIAAVADVAAMAAAFAGMEFEAIPKGATIGCSVSYVAAARGSDVTARARVVRRGRSVSFVDVEVLADAGGELVAKAQVIYKIN